MEAQCGSGDSIQTMGSNGVVAAGNDDIVVVIE